MLSDRIGSRKRPILFGRGVLVLLLFPAFMLINRFPQLPVIMSLTALMLLFYSMGSASEFALMCESFPRRVRATGISIAYALSVCVFGGTAQLVATWLIRLTGSKLAPAGYVAACVVVSLIAVSMLEGNGEQADRLIARTRALVIARRRAAAITRAAPPSPRPFARHAATAPETPSPSASPNCAARCR